MQKRHKFKIINNIMVHGTFRVIQYEIILNVDIDFYNDLLPIWICTRMKIEMKNRKLIVFIFNPQDKQLLNNSLFNEYQNAVSAYLSYEKRTEHIKPHEKFRLLEFYVKNIKFNKTLTPITKNEYESHLLRFNELKNQGVNDDNYKEYFFLLKLITVQTITHDPLFFEEIKNLEKEILNLITLTDKQNDILQKILTHEKLNGRIEWHGLNLGSYDF